MAESWESVVGRCHCCDAWGESRAMLGGRLVRICDTCGNKFYAWMIGHRVYLENVRHNSHRAYLDSRGLAASEMDWRNHFEKDCTIKAELFHITGLWLEEHKAKPGELTEAECERLTKPFVKG